ncbi:MAG: riboflavin kinase, partial [Clostridia bacterium]|nr:riboflavin kinase [Clostridia bacterium]
MQIYRLGSDISAMPKLKNTAVALGRFDAVHRGHMCIIGEAVSYAKKNNLKSVVFMFENDPSEIVSGKVVPEINTQRQREEILEALGVDIVVVKTFDREIMELDCETFIRVYLVELLGAEFASAGFNYRFGRGGAGNVDILRSICAKHGIFVSAVDEVSDGGTISSTRIRKLISDGDMETATRLLGRYFKISGVVMHGNRLGGKIIGFPTAN